VTQDNEKRTEIYCAILLVMRPEIKKLIELMDFRDAFVSSIKNTLQIVAKNCQEADVFPSSPLLGALAQAFSAIIDLDILKNSKGSFNNDFSQYKR
jgi:hypothetical protein